MYMIEYPLQKRMPCANIFTTQEGYTAVESVRVDSAAYFFADIRDLKGIQKEKNKCQEQKNRKLSTQS